MVNPFENIMQSTAQQLSIKITVTLEDFFNRTLTLAIAFVRRPVIRRQMLAANDEEAGGSSPITVFKPNIRRNGTKY